MTHISKIEIRETSGFFKDKPFDWPTVGAFSIITGTNGSGKTRLLEYLAESEAYNTSHLIRYINVDYRPPVQKHANEIENGYSSSVLIQDGKYFNVDKTGNSTEWTTGIRNFQANSIPAKLDFAIIDNIIKERSTFQNDTAFKEELSRIEGYKKNFDIRVLLPADKSLDRPWDRIDRILGDFGLSIRVDRMNLNAGLRFQRVDRSNNSEALLEMRDLSSGEKVAFSLALWTWGNSKGQRTDVLLVDEFDAHLNPSITEKYIGVIEEYFVEMGVQVIMTTHNPSTVVYGENAGADIIWMADGIINPIMPHTEIVQQLSNGLLDINRLALDAQWLVSNKKNTIVFTEGKNDCMYIDIAIRVLKRQKDFESIHIFPCTSATTIPAFLRIPFGHSKSIALFDTDAKGQEVAAYVKNMGDLKDKLDSEKLKIIHVSTEDDKEIEDLFDPTLRGNRGKYAFAKFMERSENQTKENFAGFTALLDEICRQ